jgi:hypothetical protein
LGKECPKPRDYSRVTCQNCGEKGHTKVRCKAPPKPEEPADGMGDDGFGGDREGDFTATTDEFGGNDNTSKVEDPSGLDGW